MFPLDTNRSFIDDENNGILQSLLRTGSFRGNIPKDYHLGGDKSSSRVLCNPKMGFRV